MQGELRSEGHDVSMVAVNQNGAESHQGSLSNVCAFPPFQDVDAVKAWGQHGGGKDDMFLYDSTGKLVQFLPINGSTPTNLSSADGYRTVHDLLAAAH